MDALMLGCAGAFLAFMLAAGKGRLPGYFSFAGCLLLFASLGMRWYMLGRPPWATLYETAAILALVTGIAAAYWYMKGEARALYTPLAAITVLITAFSAASWKDGMAISPALDSGWLLIHVPLAILSYGMFAISCVASIALIALCILNDKDEQALKKLDSVSHACIAVGLALLMAGIIMGALWAKDAWGSYWSWDPKETWSLITAAIYAAYLIVRKTGISAEDAALLSLLGFMAVLFTYLGVSYIIPGLHSYA